MSIKEVSLGEVVNIIASRATSENTSIVQFRVGNALVEVSHPESCLWDRMTSAEVDSVMRDNAAADWAKWIDESDSELRSEIEKDLYEKSVRYHEEKEG